MVLASIRIFSRVLVFSIFLFLGIEGSKNKNPISSSSDDVDKGGSEIIASQNTRFSSPTANSYYGYQTFHNPTLSPNPYRHSYMYNPLMAGKSVPYFIKSTRSYIGVSLRNL